MSGDGSPIRLYRVAGIFWHDHHDRDLPERGYSRPLDTTGRVVTVELDTPAFMDLYSDALHYSGDHGWDENLGYLRASARRVVDALRKQAPDLVAVYHNQGWRS